MAGEIKIDIESLDLRKLNKIIIAVENHHYFIFPVMGPHHKFDFLLKPAAKDREKFHDCDIMAVPEKVGCGLCVSYEHDLRLDLTTYKKVVR